MIAFLPFTLLNGQVRLVGPVLLFGLLGSCFGTAQSLMRGKSDSMIPNVFVMLTPVLFGGVTGLGAFGIHEYLSGLYGFTYTHWGVSGHGVSVWPAGATGAGPFYRRKRRKKAKA